VRGGFRVGSGDTMDDEAHSGLLWVRMGFGVFRVSHVAGYFVRWRRARRRKLAVMEQVEPRRMPESTVVRLGDWMSR